MQYTLHHSTFRFFIITYRMDPEIALTAMQSAQHTFREWKFTYREFQETRLHYEHFSMIPFEGDHPVSQ